MEFDDGLEDEPSVFRTPPLPDDRIWRHPSELAPAGGYEARPWTIAVVAGMVGALLASGMVAAISGLGRKTTERVVVEREQAVPTREVTNPSALSTVDIAQRARATITQVRVQAKSGSGSGSGVVFRSDGHVLTNFHVVDGADSVKVVLASGRELTASIVGTDPESDIAVLKVDGGPYSVANLGSVADLKVGQPAIAIGSPLGLAGGPSVTVGVVSALHRRIEARSGPPLLDMIQTDAPISPGSSGGALLDADGAVIGITTAVAVSEVGAEGLGFATPIDLARSAAEQLIATGKVVHVWLGVEGTDLDPDTAGDLHIDGGALVGQVVKGSPADKAGLVTRDVIVAVDGKTVATMGALVVELRRRRPGDLISLDVMRGQKHQTMRATLGERPPNP